MSDDGWEQVTWAGNRRQQHLEYYALPFAEKLRRLEELAEVSEWLLERARMRKKTRAEELSDNS